MNLNTKGLEYILIGCLAFLFPWHFRLALPVGIFNLSFGDPLVALIGGLLLVGVLTLRTLPSFTRYILSLLVVIPITFVLAIIRFPSITNAVGGLAGIVKILASVCYFITIIILTQKDRISRIHIFAFCTVLMAFVVSVWTTIETFSGVWRPSGPFNNPNLYADYLLFSLFMLLFVVDREIDTNRYYRAVFLLVPLPFILISLLGTQSRSGIGALFVGIFVLASTNWRLIFKILQKRKFFVSSAGVLFGFVLLIFSRDWAIISRFQSLTAGEATGGRFDRWSQYIDVLLDSYFIGVGWGQHQQYIESGFSLHNSLVQVTVELGIIGAIVLILIWLLVARRGLQLSMDRQYSYAIYLTAFLSATVANSMFHNNLNFRTFWMTLGLIGALEIDHWEYYNKSGREYLEDD